MNTDPVEVIALTETAQTLVANDKGILPGVKVDIAVANRGSHTEAETASGEGRLKTRYLVPRAVMS